MFASPLTLLAFASIPSVLAEGNQGNLTGLIQALNADGLDRFANITTSSNSTPTGREVLSQLSKGNNTIFAPLDDALSHLAPETLNNETVLANVVAYHVVPGNFVNETATCPNVTIGRTMLNDSSLVMLEGNKSQVLVWSKFDNGTLFVMNQGSKVTVCNSTNYNDTAILAIDTVLTPPPNISTVLNTSSCNLTLFLGFLNSMQVPGGSSALEALNSAHGITLFAPTNEAIQAAQSSLAGLSNSSIEAVALNHVINGTSVYSTEFIPSNYTSAGGQKFNLAYNSTGYYVSSGGSNQVQISETNQLTSNGVIHIVEGVMLDTDLNAAAASSAYESATAVAAHAQTGGAGPVTVTSVTATGTGTSTGTETSTSTSTASPTTTTTSGAKHAADIWKLGSVVGIVIGLCQIV